MVNVNVWCGEVNIYLDKDTDMSDWGIVHIWQSSDNVIFQIKDGYELTSEEVEGKIIYKISKK